MASGDATTPVIGDSPTNAMDTGDVIQEPDVPASKNDVPFVQNENSTDEVK